MRSSGNYTQEEVDAWARKQESARILMQAKWKKEEREVQKRAREFSLKRKAELDEAEVNYWKTVRVKLGI